MLSINIDSEDVIIKDIKRRELERILGWYNYTEAYKYATGIDCPIGMRDIVEKYLEVVYNNSEFFVGIHLKDHNSMIGLIKGRLKSEEATAIWLNSILIDTEYQQLGYGRKSLEMLSLYFKSRYNINRVYISVIEKNRKGVDFWIRNNFQLVRKIMNHIVIDGKGQDVILMKKDI
ncbi:GNAT family N-acetyltransferase [Petroclostridium sp. X23]|uniref:GNAT family N-acetyltransferase n=1 Tax=Petroclostridium sp. X23 TaxID=3045146 RepID=UPI0024ADA153|nr:GNAT family N-acetyltransferase [Petroclostridium sp. X23]WHH60439.1 GNAT family N-acetyltransferase [Petroclostridium sp. X23]